MHNKDKLMQAIFGEGANQYKVPSDTIVDKVLATITERERTVIESRFGLLTGTGLTQREIAIPFCVTPTRIWQMEGKALRKLRHPSRSRKLKGEA